MSWQDRLIAAHLTVTDAVSHSERLKSDRYFVWQEDGETALIADGRRDEAAVTGTTDLFTKQEFDPWVDALPAALEAADICCALESVQYEEDTGFYHYEWTWEVA